MEVGFIPDYAYTIQMQTCWHPGKPEQQTLFGMKFKSGAIKLDHKKMIAITTYRCPECHLLRSYAE
tara:strand:- start:306 stop:503 length:198 start_codon:yes stop_codon:yes gene_type:complete